jgi:hypothetical protein
MFPVPGGPSLVGPAGRGHVDFKGNSRFQITASCAEEEARAEVQREQVSSWSRPASFQSLEHQFQAKTWEDQKDVTSPKSHFGPQISAQKQEALRPQYIADALHVAFLTTPMDDVVSCAGNAGEAQSVFPHMILEKFPNRSDIEVPPPL